jgi:hypothetical protein
MINSFTRKNISSERDIIEVLIYNTDDGSKNYFTIGNLQIYRRIVFLSWVVDDFTTPGLFPGGQVYFNPPIIRNNIPGITTQFTAIGPSNSFGAGNILIGYEQGSIPWNYTGYITMIGIDALPLYFLCTMGAGENYTYGLKVILDKKG